MKIAAATALLLSFASPLLAEDFLLHSPVDCTLGEDCYIQQYMDRDPTGAFSDFQCRALSYDGHKGTDFAVPTRADMEAGVNVLAAADGRVRGHRDGMPDTGLTDATQDSLEGRECGNGVVLVHLGGWETQYCHLRQGSVQIENGQEVKQGDILGQIGQSGRAEFPHLHLSVRKDGTPIDPFDPDGTVRCTAPGDSTLWVDTPDYQPGGVLLAGITDSLPSYDTVKEGTAGQRTLPSQAPALVIFGFTFGTLKGDIIRMRIIGPDGDVIQQERQLDRNHAQAFRAVGKRLRAPARWPLGTYIGTVDLLRDGRVLSTRATTLTIAN